jgi:hypothetical protein
VSLPLKLRKTSYFHSWEEEEEDEEEEEEEEACSMSLVAMKKSLQA